MADGHTPSHRSTVDATTAATPPGGSFASAPTESDAALPKTDALIGASVDRYRVVAKLGAGGMGVVYRAFDPVLDRTVALKLLPPLDADRRVLLEERLRREAQALARLDHENAIAVYDVGFAETSLYIAMQFVDGCTLDEYLRARSLRPSKALALFVAAGRGLAAAHEAGIVHRDVKPSNILVDRSGRVKVGDFGLARGAERTDEPVSNAAALPLLDVSMTRLGAVLGTPAYMAPEQLRGEQATARSDQFSFCVSVWRELFGVHPFCDDDWEIARALDAMKAERIREPSRGLPARAIRALRRGLRHDPAARWPGMTELLAELEPRSRAAWYVAALAVGGLASGALVTSLVVGGSDEDPCRAAAARLGEVVAPYRIPTLIPTLASVPVPHATTTATRVHGAVDAYARQWTALRVDACRANRVRRDDSDALFDKRVTCLDKRLAALASTLDVLGKPTGDIADRAVDLVAALPALDDCSRKDALAGAPPRPADAPTQRRIEQLTSSLERARTAVRAGIFEGAEPTATKLVADARAIGWAPLVVDALVHAAVVQREVDHEPDAVALLREASTLAARVHLDAIAAEAIIEIADSRVNGGDAQAALVVVDDAEILVERAGAPPMLRARLDAVRGHALGEASKFAEADAAFVRALALARTTPELSGRPLVHMLAQHAHLLKEMSALERARAVANEAKQLAIAAHGADHPDVAETHILLGGILMKLAKIDEAKVEHARALAILERRFSPVHQNVLATLHGMAMAALHEHRYDDAAAGFAEAHRRFASVQPDHPNTYKALYMAGVARLEQGRYDDALPLFERVYSWRLEHLGDAHVATATVLEAISRIHQARDEYPKALATQERALAIREKALGSDNADVALSVGGLASLALDGGDCALASKHAHRALAILDKIHSPAHKGIDARTVLAACDVKTGRLAQARSEFETLLRLVDEPGAANVEQQVTVRVDFADLLDRQRDRSRARKLITQAIELYTAANRTADLAPLKAWLASHPL